MSLQNLLDTHTFIWFIEGDSNLSATARKLIEADEMTNFVSIASYWEIAIKISIGKLELKTPFDQISKTVVENGFVLLPITVEDTLVLSSMPFHHRDPFDRILIAQAITNKMTILTKDDHFHSYVNLNW